MRACLIVRRIVHVGAIPKEYAVNREQLIQLLSSEELSDATRVDLSDAGDVIIPQLLDILADKVEWEEDGKGLGWASVHAATLLGEMNHIESIPNLLAVLGEVEWETYLANAVTNALAEMGPAVVDPALAAYTTAKTQDVRFSLCEVLTCCGAQDERIYALLTKFFNDDPDLGATLFSIYGDARAMPMLAEKLAEHEAAHPDAAWAPDDLPSELAASIVELGGKLTEGQQAKLEAVLEDPAWLADEELIEELDAEEEDEEDEAAASASAEA